MSLTHGMGEHWGNYLLADPFKLSFIKRLIKKIVEVIKRLIPKKRKPFSITIPVLGSPFVKVVSHITTTGSPFEVKAITLPTFGSTSLPLERSWPIRGNPFQKVTTHIPTSGSVSIPISLKTPLEGNPSSLFEIKLTCEGRKDFKKILWEVLEDENGEE